MPFHLIPVAPPATRRQPGGLLGAAEPPELMPLRIFARWIDDAGNLQCGELTVMEAAVDIPGEIDWSKLVDWKDINQVW